MRTFKTAVQLITALEKLFSKRGTWIKRDYAQTKEGHVVAGSDPEAVCWCVDGGLDHLVPHGAGADPSSHNTKYRARFFLKEAAGGRHITQHNDLLRTKKQLFEWLRRAKAKARSQERKMWGR